MRRLVLAAIGALVLVLVVVAAAFAAPRAAGPSGDRVQVQAPIDKVEVIISKSNPPQYTVRIAAGLPSGCAQRDSTSTQRAGTVITIAVLNTMPKDNLVCTAIYGSYEVNIDIGSTFTPGTTYTVKVNDKTTTFTA
jgi:hypothetical protein